MDRGSKAGKERMQIKKIIIIRGNKDTEMQNKVNVFKIYATSGESFGSNNTI